MPRPIGGYRLKDGTRVLGVTTYTSFLTGDPGGLMYWAWDLGMQGKDYRKERDKAAGVGTIVHAMIDNDLMGHASTTDNTPTADVLEVSTEDYSKMLDKAEMGYRAYLSWKAGVSIEITSAEVALVSEEFHFGGTPDATARLNGEFIFLDWKSSNSIHPQYIAQVAAYDQLWYENNGERATSGMLLRVGKDEGDFHVHSWPRHVLDMGWQAFLNCKELYELNKQLKKVC
jgi:hypothetical protein